MRSSGCPRFNENSESPPMTCTAKPHTDDPYLRSIHYRPSVLPVLDMSCSSFASLSPPLIAAYVCPICVRNPRHDRQRHFRIHICSNSPNLVFGCRCWPCPPVLPPRLRPWSSAATAAATPKPRPEPEPSDISHLFFPLFIFITSTPSSDRVIRFAS